MSSDAHKTFFGTFLSELRVSRGFANINEYLRRYPVPISSVHYRHLESGNRKVSVDGAKELCEALQADSKIFYYNLLKDWMPEEFMRHFDPLSKGTEMDQEVYQKAVLQSFDLQVLYPSSEACNYLNDHMELISLVWFVYSMPNVNLEQITALAAINNIQMPVQSIVVDFEKHGLINTETTESNELVIKRVKPSISFMHDKIWSKILLHETNRSLSNYTEARNPLLKDSILLYGVMSLSAEHRQTIFRRIQDLVRDIHKDTEANSDSQIENRDPVFYSVVYAPRPQYKPAKTDKQID